MSDPSDPTHDRLTGAAPADADADASDIAGVPEADDPEGLHPSDEDPENRPDTLG